MCSAGMWLYWTQGAVDVLTHRTVVDLNSRDRGEISLGSRTIEHRAVNHLYRATIVAQQFIANISGNIRYLIHSSDFSHFLNDHSDAIKTVRRHGNERLSRTVQETAKPRRQGRLSRKLSRRQTILSRRVRRDCQRSRTLSRPRQRS